MRPGRRTKRPLRVALEPGGVDTHSPLPLLLTLLGLGLALGMFHRSQERARRPDPILGIARGVLSPLQRTSSRLQAGITVGWDWLFRGKALQEENTRLRAEIDRLRQENQQLRADADEAVRLRALLDYVRTRPGKPQVAEVIGWLPTPFAQTITLARGTGDGVQISQPVVTAEGLVGRIIAADRWTSQAQLLSDAESGVHALVLRGGKQTATGVAQGVGRDEPLQLQFIRLEEDIQAGDQVITSGYGGVFPQGIPIGTVAAVRSDPAHFTKTARLDPSAPQPGILREVLLLPLPGGAARP